MTNTKQFCKEYLDFRQALYYDIQDINNKSSYIRDSYTHYVPQMLPLVDQAIAAEIYRYNLRYHPERL